MDGRTGIVELATLTEDQARKLFEHVRWAGVPTCPHCGVVGEATLLNGKSHRKGLYQCNACKGNFTVTTKTVMHGTRISLVKWVLAFHLMCSSKKGISALQLKRQLNFSSYQTAWHMCHRIRHAMQHGLLGKMMGYKSIVEADECYVGGKPRRKKGSQNLRGRGTKKIPLMTLVVRNGAARTKPIMHVDNKTTKELMKKHIHKNARIMTDEGAHYDWTEEYFNEHFTTKHSLDEFARKMYDREDNKVNVHSNTAESYFSLIKRGFIGAFHKWGAQHIHRY